MHPAFVSRGGERRSDLVRRQPTPTRRCASSSAPPRGALPRPRSSSRRPANRCCCRARTARWPACCSGWSRADRPDKDRFLPGRLPGLLPAGIYRFANAPHDTRLAALAFALGSYKFTRYRKAEPNGAQLVIPDGVDGADLSRIAEGVTLARDLINTPANDSGRPNWRGRARPRAPGTAPRSARSSATSC